VKPAEFKKLVQASDFNGLAAAIEKLSESECSELSRTAFNVHKYLDLESVAEDGPDENHSRFHRWSGTIDLGIYGLCSREQLQAKGIGLLHRSHPCQQAVIKVLSDRRPKWASAWVDWKFEHHHGVDWNSMRELIRRGVITKPKHERYIQDMAKEMADYSWSEKDYIPLSRRLREDPAVLDDVWRFFDMETEAFTHKTDLSRRIRGFETWAVALKKVSDEGLIDRQRLLDCSLAALQLDFKRQYLTGFIHFHETMEPTAEEMRARQGRYLDLLTVETTLVGSFATKMINKIDLAKALDDVALVAVADHVFASEVKHSAMTVIGILEKLENRSPKLIPQAARIVADHAVVHPVKEVQAAALKLLTKWQENLDGVAAQQVAERLSEEMTALPATLRPGAQTLMEALQGSSAETPAGDGKGAKTGKGTSQAKAAAKATTSGKATPTKSTSRKSASGKSAEKPTSEFTARIATCQAAASRLPAQWRKLAGVDQAISACVKGTWPKPLEFDLMSVPALTGVKLVPPIATVDELLDVIAHAIENLESAIELERIFDGISRFGLQKSAAFRRRAKPLLVRRKKTQAQTRVGLGALDGDAVEPFLLVAQWLGGSSKATKVVEDHNLKTGFYLLHFMGRRIDNLRERVLAGFAGPLLSAPTHEGGWIDATILVERWREIERMKREPDRLDVIQALLRLAPDRRADALCSAKRLSHRFAAALRFALGGDETAPELDADRGPVWVAAARARVPQGDVPGTEKWTGELASLTTARATRLLPETVLAIDDNLPIWEGIEVGVSRKNDAMNAVADVPTTLLALPQAGWNTFLGDFLFQNGSPRIFEWISLTWPGNAEPFFARGLPAMVAAHALHEPDRLWGDRAGKAVILATAADDQDYRRAAIDALIDGIGDGRLSPRDLGETLSRVVVSMASTCADLKQLSKKLDALVKSDDEDVERKAAETLAGLAASLSSKDTDLKPLSKEFARQIEMTSEERHWKRGYQNDIEKVVASKTFKLNRLCAAFAEVARVSPWHAWVIAGTLETLLECYESVPDDVHHLLSLLLELMTQLGLAPGDEARAKLATIKVGGKTASLTKLLAALEPRQTSAAFEARVICAERRLERASRWSGDQTESATIG
jgi:hypothetical protein